MTGVESFRAQLRTWLEANVPRRPTPGGPAAAEMSLGSLSPAQVAQARLRQAELLEAGWAGLTYPVAYGGRGLGLEYEAAYLEESAPYEVPTAVFAVSLNILGPTLLAFGDEEQRRAHLPRMLSGEEIWLQLLSEPTGGSDLAGLLTRAERDGDVFVLRGQKIWSTGARHADFALCPARTRWDVPKHRGITMFILDMHDPGVEIHDIRQINGGHEFCQEFLNDARVPATDVVGELDGGWRVARGLLEIEHAWVGRSGGPDRRPTGVEDLVALAARRGRLADPGLARRVAAVYAAGQVHALLAARLSRGMEEGAVDPGLGGLLKLGSDLSWQARCQIALELTGSEGLTWARSDGPPATVDDYLTSRSVSIAGGTDEILRNNVGERALGLPREPAFDRDVPFDQVPHN